MRLLGFCLVSLVASLQCRQNVSETVECSPEQLWCQTMYFQPIDFYWQGCSSRCSDSSFTDVRSRCCATDLCNDLNMTIPPDYGYSTYLAEFTAQSVYGNISSLFQYSALSETSIYKIPAIAASMVFVSMKYPKDTVVTFFYNAYTAPRIPGALTFVPPVWDVYFKKASAAATAGDPPITSGFIQATTTRLLPEEAQPEATAVSWQDWALESVSQSLLANTDPKITRIPAQRHPTSPRTITPDYIYGGYCPAVVSPMSYCPIGSPFEGNADPIPSVPAGRFGLLSQLSRNPGIFYITARAYDGVLPSPSGKRYFQIACGEWQYFTVVVPANTPMVKLTINQDKKYCGGPGDLCPLATVYMSDNGGCPTDEVHSRRQVLHHSTLLTFNPYNEKTVKVVVAISADVIYGQYSAGKIRSDIQVPQLVKTECCSANSSFWEYSIQVDMTEDPLAVWRCILFLLLFAFVAIALISIQLLYAKKQGVKFSLVPTILKSGVEVAPEDDKETTKEPAKVPTGPTTTGVEIEMTDGPSATEERRAIEKLTSEGSAEAEKVTAELVAEAKKDETKKIRFAFSSVFIPDSGLALSSVLLIVGILVWTPSFQYALQLSYLDNDFASICHFNNQCRLDVLLFGWVQIKAFNQVISNFAYMMCGLYAIGYIKIDSKLQRHRGLTTRLSQRQLSTFYGIGIAIFCEGLFSGVYHVCPTLGNFQFDTIMMFFITGTVLMSLFGRRHPNSFPQSYFYVCFGGMIFTNMFGVYMYMTDYTRTFWAICLPLVIIATTLSLTHFWYNRVTPFQSCLAFFAFIGGTCGCLPDKHHFLDKGAFDQARHVHPNMSQQRKCQMAGMVSIWLLDVLFISFAAANLMYSSDAFLVLSSINMLAYLGLYISNKIWAGRNGFPTERLTWDLYLLAGCTAVFAVTAAVIFTIPVTNKALPINFTYMFSAESGGCIFLHFDKHDLWHMIGAVGLALITILVYRLDVNSDLDLAKLEAADLKRIW